MIPVRCFSCGKPVAHLWDEFKERTGKKEDAAKVMNDLGLKRFCCRALFLGHVELIEITSAYKKF